VIEQTWVWQTFGNRVNFTNFNDGEPNGDVNENCLLISQNNGKWADANCMSNQQYICEKPIAKPSPPTLANQGENLSLLGLKMALKMFVFQCCQNIRILK
jgi:Lectin C-type domain